MQPDSVIQIKQTRQQGAWQQQAHRQGFSALGKNLPMAAPATKIFTKWSVSRMALKDAVRLSGMVTSQGCHSHWHRSSTKAQKWLTSGTSGWKANPVSGQKNTLALKCFVLLLVFVFVFSALHSWTSDTRRKQKTHPGLPMKTQELGDHY